MKIIIKKNKTQIHVASKSLRKNKATYSTKISGKLKKEIRIWINGTRDYTQGLKLMMAISDKWPLYHRILHKDTKRSREKIMKDLAKAIGLHFY